MLATVRRNRWVIALLLLLFGQVGAVRASAAPTCPRSDDVAPERAPSALVADVVHAVQFMVLTDEHQHEPAGESPYALSASACGVVALPSTGGAPDLPPGSTVAYLEADAALPRLLDRAFFRPPQQS